MKIKTLSFIIVCAILICSCGVNKKINQSSSPYMTEENVTVRTESVRSVDGTEIMYGFYVIIGSFRSIENARQYNVDLVRKGFTPVILENEEGLFRISVGGFDVENAARARVTDIRANYEEYADVWLLVRRR